MKTQGQPKTVSDKKAGATPKTAPAKKAEQSLKKASSQKAGSSVTKTGNADVASGNDRENTTTSSHTQVSRDDIATLAYKIWQEQGCPEGREEQHWRQAEQAVARDDSHAFTP